MPYFYSEEMKTSLLAKLLEDGYSNIREINGSVCGLYKFLFTCAICVGLDENGYVRSYCYEHENDARIALEIWDGNDDPSGPWIKVKGKGIDMLNPLLEE